MKRTDPAAAGARVFAAGTFAAQLSNFGIQVTLPLVILALSRSIVAVAAVTAYIGVADSAGSFLGGWLTDRVRPRTVIWISTAARAAALAAIPLLGLLGALTAAAAAAVFVCDGLLRGIGESASYSYVVFLAGTEKELLDLYNSQYSAAFEAGAVLGPLAAGAVLWLGGASAANWIVALGFAAAAAALCRVPQETRAARRPGNPAQAVRALAGDRWLAVLLCEIVLLTLYPLRNALPPLYATILFKNPKLTAWLVAAFGVGGWIGARLYRARLARGVTTRTWVLLGAAATVAFAFSWAGGSLFAVAAGILVFSILNMTARLSAQSEFMSRLPLEQAGSITGLERTMVKLAAMLIKSVPAMALAATTQAKSFRVIGAVLAGAAALQAASVLLPLGKPPAPRGIPPRPRPENEPATASAVAVSGAPR